ncbi:MAG: hypothetical protein ACXW2E_01340 [Nitrososphaeraceae archaeon]
MQQFLYVNNKLIKVNEIKEINLSQIKSHTITLHYKNGNIEELSGFPAVELIWLLKPSVLEGNNSVKWKKNAWVIHNIVAHPLMQFLAWLGLYKQAIWVHDVTVPKPIDIKQIKKDI